MAETIGYVIGVVLGLVGIPFFIGIGFHAGWDVFSMLSGDFEKKG